jgi:hypothetical protein
MATEYDSDGVVSDNSSVCTDGSSVCADGSDTSEEDPFDDFDPTDTPFTCAKCGDTVEFVNAVLDYATGLIFCGGIGASEGKFGYEPELDDCAAWRRTEIFKELMKTGIARPLTASDHGLVLLQHEPIHELRNRLDHDCDVCEGPICNCDE